MRRQCGLPSHPGGGGRHVVGCPPPDNLPLSPLRGRRTLVGRAGMAPLQCRAPGLRLQPLPTHNLAFSTYELRVGSFICKVLVTWNTFEWPFKNTTFLPPYPPWTFHNSTQNILKYRVVLPIFDKNLGWVSKTLKICSQNCGRVNLFANIMSFPKYWNNVRVLSGWCHWGVL